ncbi:MAG: hypothetical protein MUC53_08395 [Candidatus Contendobacter sp.]|jgi:hypothetical protein|nr:hypothetical protein [Candidatus Contendobacter sp.]
MTPAFTGDETVSPVAQLRSEIAQALHCPVIVDSLARKLLEECSKALGYLEREAAYWRREWQASEELYWAETNDGK